MDSKESSSMVDAQMGTLTNDLNEEAMLYRSFLERESIVSRRHSSTSNALSSLDYHSRSLNVIVGQFFRFGLIKLGLFSLSMPMETLVFLHQIQFRPKKVVESTTRLEQLKRSTSTTSRMLVSSASDDLDNVNRKRLEDSEFASKEPVWLINPWMVSLHPKLGVWANLSRISRRQGFLSLWQGLGLAWSRSILFDISTATIEESLMFFCDRLMGPSDLVIEEQKCQWTLIVASSLAQSASSIFCSTWEASQYAAMARTVEYSSLDAMREDEEEEEDVIDNKFAEGKRSLMPFAAWTGICGFIQPLLGSLPVVIGDCLFEWQMSSSEWHSSLLMTLGRCALQNVLLLSPLIITIPLEVIRRRLLLQWSLDDDFKCGRVLMHTSRQRYAGPWDCLKRMIRDEEDGFWSLYRGWQLHATSITARYLLQVISEVGEQADFGIDEGF